MRLAEHDIAEIRPLTEPGTFSDLRDPVEQCASRGARWMKIYLRLAGCIQWLYALVFGYYAIGFLRYCYRPEFRGKGVYPAHLSLLELFFGMDCALLSLCAFAGGFGLLGLRRWARRCEIAYVVFLSAGVTAVTAVMALDIRMGPREFWALGLFSLAFVLPFVPFFTGAANGCSRRGS
jgi:hypothetical protein